MKTRRFCSILKDYNKNISWGDKNKKIAYHMITLDLKLGMDLRRRVRKKVEKREMEKMGIRRCVVLGIGEILLVGLMDVGRCGRQWGFRKEYSSTERICKEEYQFE